MKAIEQLKAYIEKTLGVRVDATRWNGEGTLPLFLRDGYRFFRLILLNCDCLFMLDRQAEERAPAIIRKHMDQVRDRWPGEVVYAREQVTAYNRDRLVRNKVPFIVPGKQLYLPMLAMDLREHFIQQRTVVEKISPATQVLVLHSIYEHLNLFDGSMTYTEWAQELRFAKMTMTRAFRELRNLLADDGNLPDRHGKALWNRLKPHLRNPVRRRLYFAAEGLPAPKRFLAGQSALAYYSMLAPPDHRIICMGAKRWANFLEKRTPVKLNGPEPGALEVEVWRYMPVRLARGSDGVADPLSVYLSFEVNTDERIDMALETMLEDVSW